MKTLSVYPAVSYKEKLFGLIGQTKPYPIMFKTRWGIHTLGVQFPIDVIILTNSDTIHTFKSNLKPNSIFVWNPLYYTVVELPAGTIEKYALRKGEKINLQFLDFPHRHEAFSPV